MSIEEISLNFESNPIVLKYLENDLPFIQTCDDNAYAYAQGYLHGKDRCMQLTLLQAIMQSKLGLWFEASDETYEIDKYMAKLGMYYQARKEESQLVGEDRKYLKSYTEGLNQGRRSYWPKIFEFMKVPLETWTMADSLTLLKLMGYMGLASSQKDTEKFIAQCLHSHVSPEYIASLFQVEIRNKDYDVFELLKKVSFDQELIPKSKFFKAIPTLKNSNNWIVGKTRSKNGSPIMAFDPHLEINRFPAIWYESSVEIAERKVVGITMPGIPGIVMGRNQDLAFSFTYGFMDTIDYFIEEIKREEVIEDEGQTSGLIKRKEIIRNKKNEKREITLFETQRGILEVADSSLTKMGNLEDGLYLSRAWSGHQQGSAQAIGLMRQIPYAKNVQEGCHLVKNLFISCNWLFCDQQGNIGYQQSGYLPERADAGSGLIPRLAQDKTTHWKSIHSPQRLAHEYNPPEDFLASANHAIKAVDEHDNVNLSMANYRYDRIKQFLDKETLWEPEQMKALQSDIYSLQAFQYMELIKSFIPDTPNGRLMSEWDCRFEGDSKVAYLYSRFLEETYLLLFAPAFGEQAWDHLVKETALIADYYGHFDRIIFKPSEQDAVWFNSFQGKTLEEKRDNLLKKSLTNTLSKAPKNKMKTWSEHNCIHFTHILFGEKLSQTPVLKRFFNKGPYPLRGDKTTVCQGNLFKSTGRVSTFAPSYRMITQMNSELIFSALPGAANESVLRKNSFHELKRFLNLQYKTIKMELP